MSDEEFIESVTTIKPTKTAAANPQNFNLPTSQNDVNKLKIGKNNNNNNYVLSNRL